MTLPLQSADARIFATRLNPYRSLTPKGATRLLFAFGCVTAAISIPFYFIGAWPVIGFLGLDVLVLYVAFRVSFRSAEAYETLLVTPLEVEFVKVSPRGAREVWRFNPVWVRVEEETHEEFGAVRVSLKFRDQSIEVGGFLGPDQKAELARNLAAALVKARLGPRFAQL